MTTEELSKLDHVNVEITDELCKFTVDEGYELKGPDNIRATILYCSSNAIQPEYEVVEEGSDIEQDETTQDERERLIRERIEAEMLNSNQELEQSQE